MEEKKNIQIRERAGLEESRLNQDFIDFLAKWSTPVLVVVALIVGGNYFYKQYKDRQTTKLSEGFRELSEAATGANPSPDSLKAVAARYRGVASVGELASLKAGDAYMRAIIRGVKPGADVNADGTVKEVGDELTAEDRAGFLASAEEQYRLVIESSANDPSKTLLRLGGLFGLASVAESRGDADKAKAAYEQVKSIASAGSEFKHFIEVAESRIASLPKVIAVAKLPTKASLPAPFKEDPKPADNITIPTVDAPGTSAVIGPAAPQPAEPAGPQPPATPETAPAEKPAEPAQPKN